MTTKIQILGPGCSNCDTLYRNTEAAMAELGADAEVEKISDVNEMVRRGILISPALVVNDQLVLAGQVPSTSRLREVLAPLV